MYEIFRRVYFSIKNQYYMAFFLLFIVVSKGSIRRLDPPPSSANPEANPEVVHYVIQAFQRSFQFAFHPNEKILSNDDDSLIVHFR